MVGVLGRDSEGFHVDTTRELDDFGSTGEGESPDLTIFSLDVAHDESRIVDSLEHHGQIISTGVSKVSCGMDRGSYR